MADIIIKGFNAVYKLHDPKIINLAVRQALNKTVKQARTAVSKSIRQTYNISATRLKDIKVKTAIKGEDRVSIITKGKRPGLQHASPKEVRRMHGVNVSLGISKDKGLVGKKGGKLTGGVKVKVRKDHGYKVIKTAFLTYAKGAVGIYRREFIGPGKQGKKLLRLTMPSPVHMFGRKESQEAISKVVDEKFYKLYDDAFKYFIKRNK